MCMVFQTLAGFNYGAYRLQDYHINIPESSVSFLRVSRVSEALTPRLIQTFYRSNFTMTRPWLTRLLRHMSLLPPSMPGGDEAQVRVGGGRVGEEGGGGVDHAPRSRLPFVCAPFIRHPSSLCHSLALQCVCVCCVCLCHPPSPPSLPALSMQGPA